MNQEGLKIDNLRIRNGALLAKWLWCFSLEPESLWHRIIVSKHGAHPIEWMSKWVKGTHRNLWKEVSFELPMFSRFTRCFVWDGEDLYFQEDHWVGESSLRSLFSHLYHLSSLKNCMVSNCLVSLVDRVSFSFGFHCNLTKREVM